jgi:hypothetical protein
MNNLSPYAPIEKTPLYAADDMKSRGYSVRVQNEEAETGWSEISTVSEDYLLVPNREVRNMALEIARASPFEWSEEKVRFDGKRFSYALVADGDSYAREVTPGDVVNLGLLFRNSYDGSLKLSASMFAFRLICEEKKLMDRLEEQSSTLDDLSEEIIVGLQTSADYIYTVEDRGRDGTLRRVYSEASGEEIMLEEDLLKPLVSGKDAERHGHPQTGELLIFLRHFRRSARTDHAGAFRDGLPRDVAVPASPRGRPARARKRQNGPRRMVRLRQNAKPRQARGAETGIRASRGPAQLFR